MGYIEIMPTTKNLVIRARVDSRLKKDSEAVLAKLGLSAGEAIRMFLAQITLKKGLPFDVSLPRKNNDDILMSATKRQAILDRLQAD